MHATGLQCLLSDPKMTRATCESQLYGGLRCYDGDAPTVARAADVPGDDRDPPPEAGGGDDSLPFGWGERQSNLSERELVRRGKIIADASG